ncbi:MAG: NAD-dependent epimerase/dehydratase family protein [Alphaproteobacteria bacterium]|nr:NAD-dependent epimerase/dehydratase family protein [Alphaproteobacteria bacterium]
MTGAGGFLGRWLCRALLRQGWDVHGTQRRAAVPDAVVAWDADLREPEAWARIFAEVRPDAVFHLAATVDVQRTPDAYPMRLDDIAAVTDRVARSCLDAGARLVHVGTCEEYGDGPVPFREDQRLQPVSPYSAAKAAASLWVDTLMRTQGLRATVVRPFLTYGPGQGGRGLVPAAARAALAGVPFAMTAGTQTREWNHVADIAEGLARAADPRAVGHTLNLGGGPERSVRDVAARVFDLAGADPALLQVGALPARPGEIPRFYGDHTRFHALLGAPPRASLDQGLQEVLASLRDTPPPSPRPLRERLRVQPVRRVEDPRGALDKLWPGPVSGEVYRVTARPGQDRGHHLHRRMGEWFMALEGEGALGVADPDTGASLWMPLGRERVYVPAGVAHALRNTGTTPFTALAVAERGYDPGDVASYRVPEP